MWKLRGEETAGLRSRERCAWLYIAAMMFCILLSLPVTPILWSMAARAFGPGFNILGYVVLAAIALGFVLYMLSHPKQFGVSRFVFLIAFAIVYSLLLKYHCRFPAERLHLMEYGILAYLAYRAFRFRFQKMMAYLWGFAFSSAFGLADEAIQFILPNRVFELRDVVTNAIASALGILVAIVVLKANDAADKHHANQT